MSVNYNVLGLIFASLHDKNVSELTDQRTMGSIPFGGRYRRDLQGQTRCSEQGLELRFTFACTICYYGKL